MKKVIVSSLHVREFLSYCISYGYEPTAINKEFKFIDTPEKFIFRLNKPITEEDYANLKRCSPTFDLYTL